MTTNAMMRRETFLRELNHSYRVGSLGGQFNDRELAGYIAFKKRQHGPFHSLHAVANVGRQENGTWVLSRDLFFDSKGQRITPATSGSLWVSHLYSGLGVAAQSEELEIASTLSTSGLTVLINEMEPLFGGVYIMLECMHVYTYVRLLFAHQ